MKDNLSFLLPIKEDDTNVISRRNEFRNMTSISSNGYYGYQPVVEKYNSSINREHTMDVQMTDSEIQFNNYIPSEENVQNRKKTLQSRGQIRRKRYWGYDYETEYPEFKRWRENEREVNPAAVPHTPPCQVNLRKPTHNMPDLPRCISGHYI